MYFHAAFVKFNVCFYVLPGRIPGYWSADIMLLPSSLTKKALWELYRTAMQDTGARVAGERTFMQIWKQVIPFVVIMKPRSDLFTRCQRNNRLIVNSANTTDAEKQECLRVQIEHLDLVKHERQR